MINWIKNNWKRIVGYLIALLSFAAGVFAYRSLKEGKINPFLGWLMVVVTMIAGSGLTYVSTYQPDQLFASIGSGWNRKAAITIDNTKVSGSANHTDFPVLLTEANLPSEMFDADGSFPANNGGGDIRFSSDSDGVTELAREVVNFVTDNDPANGTAEIWVKVPTLDYNDDTVIYVWYNNTSASEPASDSTYGSEAVWSNNYVFVSHGLLSDSTSNSHTVGDTSTSASSTSIIGSARTFDGSSSRIDVTDAATLDITGAITISAWIYGEDYSGGFETVVTKGKTATGNGDSAATPYFLGTRSSTAKAYITNGSDESYILQDGALSTNTWHYENMTWDGTTGTDNINLYLNTTNTGGAAQTSVSSMKTNNTDVVIGFDPIRNTDDRMKFDGTIDEVRISNTERSADWVATEYSNQKSPGAFSSAGTPESVAAADTCTYTSGNWTVLYSDTCVISSDVWIDSGSELRVIRDGAGSFKVTNGASIYSKDGAVLLKSPANLIINSSSNGVVYTKN